MKSNLRDGEGILHTDFSENFQIKQQDEIMAAHWVCHYLHSSTEYECWSNFFCSRDDLDHNKFAVIAFNRVILESAECSVETLHIVTDGAASQFKTRFSLSNIM